MTCRSDIPWAHGSRRVRVLGATEHPGQAWVVQQARNLLMDLEDTGPRVKFVLHDRDASFTAAFDAVCSPGGGSRPVRSGRARLSQALGILAGPSGDAAA